MRVLTVWSVGGVTYTILSWATRYVTIEPVMLMGDLWGLGARE
jgi:hypothetical protein